MVKNLSHGPFKFSTQSMTTISLFMSDDLIYIYIYVHNAVSEFFFMDAGDYLIGEINPNLFVLLFSARRKINNIPILLCFHTYDHVQKRKTTIHFFFVFFLRNDNTPLQVKHSRFTYTIDKAHTSVAMPSTFSSS